MRSLLLLDLQDGGHGADLVGWGASSPSPAPLWAVFAGTKHPGSFLSSCGVCGLSGSAVFVEGWLIKAGKPWRKVRLGLGTAVPSGLCTLPELGSALWPLPPWGREGNPRPQREAAVVDGTRLRRKRWQSGRCGLHKGEGVRVNLGQRETCVAGWGTPHGKHGRWKQAGREAAQ